MRGTSKDVPLSRFAWVQRASVPEKCGSEGPDPLGEFIFFFYFAVGPLEAAGGHGVPFGETPAEFPWPDVEGEVLGEVDDEPEFDEPEFEPAFGCVLPAVLGMFPHGEPLGVVPGAVV